MRYVVYYRNGLLDDGELEAAEEAGFTVTSLLTDLELGDFVIPRYTTLPFAQDIHREFQNIGCTPINTIEMHEWMADIFKWTPWAGEMTPKTYNQYDMQRLPEGSYVLKGATNSKKAYWNTHMFAPSKKDVPLIFANLVDDSLIGNQEIAIREYVPLRTFMEGINGMPVTREYRCFFLGKELLAKGFYWANYVDDIDPELVDHKELFSFRQWFNEIPIRVSPWANFYCVDIAQTAEGNWIVIEINDGTMAGLSCIDPKEFYKKLYERVTNQATE